MVDNEPARYWPRRTEITKTFEDITVTWDSEEKKEEYTKTTLFVTRTTEVRSEKNEKKVVLSGGIKLRGKKRGGRKERK